MEVNIKKLLEQEVEAREFVNDVLYEFMINDKSHRELIKAIYNFYEIGMTVDQVARWISRMQRMGSNNG